MIDELDISLEKKRYFELKAREVIQNLTKLNMNGVYVSDRVDALNKVMEMIPGGASIGRGNSISVDQVGIFEALEKRGINKIIDFLYTTPEHYASYPPEESYQLERDVFFADFFISGSNAITLDGKLVNTDGVGNRVAPMIFGPRKVIFVVGVNKIVKNLDEAILRIHNVAAPINSMRHQMKGHFDTADLACARTGKCVDCKSPARACRFTVIIEGNLPDKKDRINVVLVGEELGI